MRWLLVIALVASACTARDEAPKQPPGYPSTPEALVLAYHEANSAQRWSEVRKYIRHVDAAAQERQLAAADMPALPDLSPHISRRVLDVVKGPVGGAGKQGPEHTLVSLEETRPDPSALIAIQRELMAGQEPTAALGQELLPKAFKRFAAEVEAGKVKPRTMQRTYRVIVEDGVPKIVLFLAEMERATQLDDEARALRASGDDAGANSKLKERDAVLKLVPNL